jgi:hypothetical protein
MPTHSTATSPAASPVRALRIEYLSFTNATDHRAYRFAVHAPDGVATQVLRVALSSFGAHLRLQDGPDICYQVLVRALAGGAVAGGPEITLSETDLSGYREAHTPVPKRRSVTPNPNAPPRPPSNAPGLFPRPRGPLMPVAPPQVVAAPTMAFPEGQRVSHPVHGEGVTGSTADGRTSISFDADGVRTFVTAMLEVEVLSGPGTWETTARGKNRPRETEPAGR